MQSPKAMDSINPGATCWMEEQKEVLNIWLFSAWASISTDIYLFDNPNSFFELSLASQWMRQWFGEKKCVWSGNENTHREVRSEKGWTKFV